MKTTTVPDNIIQGSPDYKCEARVDLRNESGRIVSTVLFNCDSWAEVYTVERVLLAFTDGYSAESECHPRAIPDID